MAKGGEQRERKQSVKGRERASEGFGLAGKWLQRAGGGRGKVRKGDAGEIKR